MPQLRWTLLLLGVLFLAGLAWWELRRPRQGRRGDLANPSGNESSAARAEIQREPTLTLPEIRARDPLPELPLIEVVDDSEILRIEDDRDEDIDLLAGDEAGPIVPSPELQAGLDPLREEEAAPLAPSADPIVEWPDEGTRRVLALRLIAPGERFSGVAVRQALASEGFVLGKLAIFHRAGPGGRAVVSVVNLTKPGTFDLESIDMRRFEGLNLFSVLPGPLPPVRAFDELLASARNLSDRLQGVLQDEQGETLTPLRAAEIREGLEAQTEHES